jgi:hypothetical protein
MATDNKVPVRPRAWNILSAVYDGVNQEGYVNGDLQLTTPFQLNTTDAPAELGARTVQSGAQWRAAGSDGDFAEMLVYNRALDRFERRQVENYLSAKWFKQKHVPTQSTLVWCDTGLDDIAEFLYSKADGQFLISTTNLAGVAVWRLNPAASADARTIQVLKGCSLGDIRSAGSGRFVYAASSHGRSELLASGAGGQPVSLTAFQSIRWFETGPEGKKVVVWGTLSNEPGEGVWEYDPEANKVRSLLAYSQYPSEFAKEIRPGTGNIRLPSGRTIACTIFTPPNFDRKKKYPLVLGDTYVPDKIHGHWLQAGMAAGGAFVVFVERPNWNAYIEQWEENVRAVYDILKQDPCIDTSQVFLIGASAETQYMNPCMEKTPGLWKGVILLNPGLLPDFSKSPRGGSRPKVLISAGGEERRDAAFKKFQEEAQRSGVTVECLIAPTEPHRFVGSAGKLARLQAINHFIFDE